MSPRTPCSRGRAYHDQRQCVSRTLLVAAYIVRLGQVQVQYRMVRNCASVVKTRVGAAPIHKVCTWGGADRPASGSCRQVASRSRRCPIAPMPTRIDVIPTPCHGHHDRANTWSPLVRNTRATSCQRWRFSQSAKTTCKSSSVGAGRQPTAPARRPHRTADTRRGASCIERRTEDKNPSPKCLHGHRGLLHDHIIW